MNYLPPTSFSSAGNITPCGINLLSHWLNIFWLPIILQILKYNKVASWTLHCVFSVAFLCFSILTCWSPKGHFSLSSLHNGKAKIQSVSLSEWCKSTEVKSSSRKLNKTTAGQRVKKKDLPLMKLKQKKAMREIET